MAFLKIYMIYLVYRSTMDFYTLNLDSATLVLYFLLLIVSLFYLQFLGSLEFLYTNDHVICVLLHLFLYFHFSFLTSFMYF